MRRQGNVVDAIRVERMTTESDNHGRDAATRLSPHQRTVLRLFLTDRFAFQPGRDEDDITDAAIYKDALAAAAHLAPSETWWCANCRCNSLDASWDGVLWEGERAPGVCGGCHQSAAIPADWLYGLVTASELSAFQDEPASADVAGGFLSANELSKSARR